MLMCEYVCALPVADKIPSMQSVEVINMLPVVEKMCIDAVV